MKLHRLLNPASAFLTVAFTCLGSSFLAAQEPSTTVWTGADDNWNTGANWDPSIPTTGSLAGILNGATVTVAAPAAVDLAQVLVDGGSVLSLDSSLGVTGTDVPATGLYVNTGSLDVNSGGALSVTTGGLFRVGNGANGTLTLASGGSITTDRFFTLGTGASNSVFNQTGGTLTHSTGEFRVGAFDATGVYNLSGGSAAVNILKVGYAGQGMGTFTVSGASTTLALTGDTSIAWDASSSGEMNIEDGTVTAGRIRVGVAGVAPAVGVRTAVLNQSGGALSLTTGSIEIGDAMPAAVVNQVNLSGGSLSVVTGTSEVRVGHTGTSSGILNVSGDANVTLRVLRVSNGAQTNGTVNVSGGTLNVPTDLTVGPNAAVTSTAALNVLDSGNLETPNLRIRNGTVTQSDGSIYIPSGGGGFFVGIDTAGYSTYSLSGGSLISETRFRQAVNTTGGTLFDQTAGDFAITGRFEIAENGGPNNVYQISGGTLTSTDNAYVGAYTTGTATFNVSGTADVDFGGSLAIARVSTVGNMNLTGGSVAATTATVGEGATAQGTLNVGGTGLLELTGLLVRNGTVTQSGAGSLVDVLGETIIGNGNTLNATYNMQGGTLVSVGRLRFGTGTAVRTNLFEQTGGAVELKNRLDIGEIAGSTNICRILGGSMSLTGADQRILVGAFKGGSGTWELAGSAEVSASSVVVGEQAALPATQTEPAYPTTAGTVTLNGGVVITDQIKTGNAPASAGTLNLNGGTIRSRSGAAVNIDGNRPANLLAGGVTFDVPDSGWTTTTTGLMTGPGGLTKIGPGTLVVNGNQAYTGATRVQEGTLSLVQPYLSADGDVYLTTGATLDLQFEGGRDIRTLYIDDVAQPPGPYGNAETDLIAGPGILNATVAGNTIEPKILSITRSGTTATIVFEGAPSTQYLVRSSLDLSLGSFSPIATTPATVTTDGAGDATFTVDATESKKFYIVEEAP